MIATDELNALRAAMHKIAIEKGPFTLFALLMRADSISSYDLVVAAPWLTDGKLETLRELTRLLSAELGEDGLRRFSRVVTLEDGDPGLEALLSTFPLDEGEPLHIRNETLFGLDIEDAVIMRARRAA